CEFPDTARLPAGHICEIWGRAQRFGITRIGRGRVYWYAALTAPAGGVDSDAAAELAQLFDRWPDPVVELIRATPTGAIRRDDLYDRAPTRGWSRGRLTLLGDAAHPMTPNLGHG